MPKIIFTSRYIKNATSAQGANLVNYVATREGVEIPGIINGNRPATENQQKLIKEILNTVPEIRESFEYEDYLAASTVSNASELITSAFENNPILWGSVRNYVDYIAKRPGAARSQAAGHGLWNGSDNKIVLSQAMDEVANHKGNLWTHIVSLRRDDAERMGYANADAWRDLVRSKIPVIAEAMKIPLDELHWYAAYHNRANNPHIHLIVYSQNPTYGFLTEPGIEKMRSAFATEIYQNELLHIYEQKDAIRARVNEFADERMRELMRQIENGGADPALAALLSELAEKLKHTSGKKQYGYLKPELKRLVYGIVEQLAADPRVDEMYRHWCVLTAEVKRFYTSDIPAPPPLAEEKSFKTIKNMVIRQALEIYSTTPMPAARPHSASTPDAPAPDIAPDLNHISLPDDGSGEAAHETIEPDYAHSGAHVTWSEKYKLARRYLFKEPKDFKQAYTLLLEEAEAQNALAMYDAGYMHLNGLSVELDTEVAQAWFAKAYSAFVEAETGADKLKPYVQYRVGKQFRDGYGVEQNYSQAAAWFKKSAEQGNQYAQYSLGGLYLRGQGVEMDHGRAIGLFMLSAEQGNAYAAYEIAKMYEIGDSVAANQEQAWEYYHRAFEGFRKIEAENPDDKLQYRLGKMLLDGKGVEVDLEHAAGYFRKAAQNHNLFAQYTLAKLILDTKIAGDISEAIVWMTKAAEQDNQFAQYALGKLYLSEECRDVALATKWLTAAAEQGNEYARFMLEHMNGSGFRYSGPALLRSLSRLINDDYQQQRKNYEQAVDSKLMQKIRRKKQDLGQKFE